MLEADSMKRFAADIPHKMASFVAKAIQLTGKMLLTRDQTIALFQKRGFELSSDSFLSLSSQNNSQALRISRSGLAIINNFYLDLDYGTRRGLLDFEKPKIFYPEAAALWSHQWMGYYHWLVDIAPKICLLKHQLGDHFEQVKLCYPSSGEPYEREILAMLGVPETSIHDTLRDGPVKCQTLWVNPLPGWEKIHPAARLLRADVLKSRDISKGPEKIYLKRAGRRRCLNEVEICVELKKRGFVIIEDISRPVYEQIDLFRSARVIVAPHGAALSNLLWFDSGSKVIELMSASYFPDYYKNLAEFFNISYQRIVSPSNSSSHWSAVNHDFSADLEALGSTIDKMSIG